MASLLSMSKEEYAQQGRSTTPAPAITLSIASGVFMAQLGKESTVAAEPAAVLGAVLAPELTPGSSPSELDRSTSGGGPLSELASDAALQAVVASQTDVPDI